MSPPIPANEVERLKALYRYDILDTLPEQEFDDLTLLASQICHTPIALISLVDSNRQWFKSQVGLGARETAREVSFCAHAVGNNADLTVADATKDPRFFDNPLVLGDPEIRFYAGTLLKTPEGQNIGTLCVMDRQPHDLTESEEKALQALGRQVVSQLELRLMVKKMTETIAEREQAEQALRESDEKYRIVLGSTTDLVATLNKAGQLLYVNPAWQERLGYSCEELDRLSIFELVHVTRREKFQQDYAQVLGGTNHRIETLFLSKDGEEIDVEGNLNGQVQEGQSVSIQGFFRDVTERKMVEKLKEEFISIVSHELRTPLTAILGSLGLVAGGISGPVPDKALAMIEVAHKNSERLVLLINDILDIEKIESGKMHFDMRPTFIVPLVGECLSDNRGYAERLGVGFRIENKILEQDAALEVYVDPHRLCQVMGNLLSNAAKFSPAGDEVLVTLEALPARPVSGGLGSEGQIRVSVHDNGAGVPPEFRDRIFQKFAQADSSDTRQKGGTGLGLNISKAIVQQFGGVIDFDSAPSQGTTFYFDLPIYVKSEGAERAGSLLAEGN